MLLPGSQPETAPNSSESKKTAEPSVNPLDLKREQVRRTVALVIDDLGLSYESFGYARKALMKFVDEQMQPNDMVAILRTSAGVGVLQQFTSDKRQLHAAIERVRWNPTGRGGLSPGGTMNEAQYQCGHQRTLISSIRRPKRVAPEYIPSAPWAQSTLVVRGMGEMPGRKSIVLISEAFEMFNAQGRNDAISPGIAAPD